MGGFLGLELSQGSVYHASAVALNSGRAALEYILLQRKFKKIYLPIFTCSAIEETVRKVGIKFEKYNIDNNLNPIFDLDLIYAEEVLLYTNYFGIKNKLIKNLIRMDLNIIVDNSQAFYEFPENGVDAFYSPRKFFGVPDGGYAYVDIRNQIELSEDFSYKRFGHLLQRLEGLNDNILSLYQDNEKIVANCSMQAMSEITRRLLQSINYKFIKKQRKLNFNHLHESLGKVNHLTMQDLLNSTPLSYPILLGDGDLRTRLSDNLIFTPTYWPNILQECPKNSLEYMFANQIVHLPIDQRYSKEDMDRIINIVLK